jgi:hypothetical protein
MQMTESALGAGLGMVTMRKIFQLTGIQLLPTDSHFK